MLGLYANPHWTAACADCCPQNYLGSLLPQIAAWMLLQVWGAQVHAQPKAGCHLEQAHAGDCCPSWAMPQEAQAGSLARHPCLRLQPRTHSLQSIHAVKAYKSTEVSASFEVVIIHLAMLRHANQQPDESVTSSRYDPARFSFSAAGLHPEHVIRRLSCAANQRNAASPKRAPACPHPASLAAPRAPHLQ